MADFPILTSPDGSTSINVGSVMLADGVDYGMAPMFANGLGGNPFVDGGQLGYRYSGPRMFKFPIRLATVGNMTPAGVARAFRQMAQNGAYVDLMLAGVATADAVRFDVIDGRVRESHDVKMWAGAGRREGVLELDVQPYGYLPTWITLASVPSIALPGSIPIPGGSVIGDVPGLAQIMVMSSLPSQQFGGVGTYGYDTFFYSLGNKAPAFMPAGSLGQITNSGPGVLATLTAAPDAPASQVQRVFISPSVSAVYNVNVGWQPLIFAALNPSYFGRYRVHVLARLNSPSYGGAIPLSAEIAMSGLGNPTSFASGGLIASVGQPLTLASDGAYSPIPTAFGFFPLGDMKMPTSTGANNVFGGHRLQIWGNVPSMGLPTISLDIAGVWLQSLEAGQGVIAAGLQNQNAAGAASYYGMYPFAIDAAARDVQTSEGVAGGSASTLPALWMASQLPAFSLLDRYRGVFPQVSPSMLSIEVMLAARRLQVSYRNEILTDTPKVWWRFNEPSGASVVLDWSGNGINGQSLSPSNVVLGASSLLYGEPGGATGGGTGIFITAAGAAIPAGNAPRTVEAWYKPASLVGPVSAHQTIVALGATEAAGGIFTLALFASAIINYVTGGNPSWPYAWQAGQTLHLAAAYSGTYTTLYVNGQAQATQTLPAALNTTARISVGNIPSNSIAPANGGIDEVAVYPSALSANRILAHYLAGRNTQGATSPPVYHQGGYAGVSVRYQPRFAFQKEL